MAPMHSVDETNMNAQHSIFSHVLRAIALLVVVALLYAAISTVQTRLTARKDASWTQESMSYLPQSSAMSRYLLGYQTTYANYLWIKTMLYFGSHYSTDQDFRWLVSMVDIVTKLNPQFYPAYEFAGVMLPDFCKAPDAARTILMGGLGTYRGDKAWRIPYFLGYLYDRSYGDTLNAASFMALAAQDPKASVTVSGLAATYYTRMGQTQRAIAYLASMYETTENPDVKKHLKEKLDALLRAERAAGRGVSGKGTVR